MDITPSGGLSLLPAFELIPSGSGTRIPQQVQAVVVKIQPKKVITREELEEKLQLSIKAICDRREAPWYGPWALALEILFMNLSLPSPSICITTPQLPAIATYDPAVDEDKLRANSAAGHDDDSSGTSDVEVDEDMEQDTAVINCGVATPGSGMDDPMVPATVDAVEEHLEAAAVDEDQEMAKEFQLENVENHGDIQNEMSVVDADILGVFSPANAEQHERYNTERVHESPGDLVNRTNFGPPRYRWSHKDAYPDDDSAITLTDTTQPTSPITPTMLLFPTQPPNTLGRTYSIDSNIPPLIEPGTIRSTRVPDFSTVITIFNQVFSFLGNFLILIVEIKAPSKSATNLVLLKAIAQVLEQADHAFEGDSSLDVLGCILAAGDCWTYFDIKREDFPSPPKQLGRTRSESKKKGITTTQNPESHPKYFDMVKKLKAPSDFLRPIFDGVVDDENHQSSGSNIRYLKLFRNWDQSKLAFGSILEHLLPRIHDRFAAAQTPAAF